MSKFRQALKSITPAPLWEIARESRDAFDRALQLPAAAFHPWRRDTISRLHALKDTHRGERCFIIGNGPSLKHTDLSRLSNECSIGMNRFYLAYPDLGFTNTYYLAINDLVVEQCAADIQRLQLPVFLSWRGRKWVTPAENIYYLFTTYTGPRFTRDIARRLWEGATVTYTALQLAYYLGFQQVILIGVDHNFVTKGKPNTTVISNGDDPNHFDPRYFGKGFRWQLPDLETSERAYTLARDAYERAGHQILDATIGGKLRIFPRVAYDSLF
jgi:hypothetical protein